jgi:leader peptidase (prepilin peptidase)/N-methyltransferase
MTPTLVPIAGVFGLMVGSFLNVCISRLPAGESVVTPRSRCPRCRSAIAWFDNVPVVSFLVLGGKCRHCRAPIGVKYPLVELTTAAAFMIQAAVIDDPALLAVRLVFTAMLIVLFGTDLETMRLPNVITLPGIVIGLAASAFLPPGLLASAIGAAAGAASLWTVRGVWFRATGVEGMGLGDVKMLAMIGAFLGWEQVWVVLLLASLSGAAIGLALIAVGGRRLSSRLPFGTYLAIAAYLASIIGPDLVTWNAGLYAA